ncbi:DUF4365 domain-containing protein [Undibacterium sp. Ji42W]|uniref:DUF4365 domain-containing protein n=1 Tax=Undibacterium sp. Ji42W TaxID=3413039 RepID=UPI003BF257CB
MNTDLYPKRHLTHVAETVSKRIFEAVLPDEWIVRELGERDYGIDLILELADTHVRGDSISIQLKGKEEISWNRDGNFSFSGISKQTTNYWFTGNLPVFLILVDRKVSEIYFVSVKKHIRRNFSVFKSGQDISYRFIRSAFLSKGDISRFLEEYIAEKNQINLYSAISSAIEFNDKFSSFIEKNYGRDGHMMVDDEDRVNQVTHIWERVRLFCQITNGTWNIPTIKDLAKEMPYNKYNDIAEYHFTEMINQLDEKYFTALQSMHRLVIAEEPDFWMEKEPSAFRFFSEMKEISPLKMFKKDVYGWH